MPSSPKSWTLWALFGLAVLITLLAFNGPTPPSRAEIPPVPVRQEDGTEHRLQLSDGRTVLCLTFMAPTPAVTCDWTHPGAS